MLADTATSVMVVSTTDKAAEFIKSILPKNQFSPIYSVHGAGEAQRCLLERGVDIVVINAPLKDEFGTQLAINIMEHNGAGVLLMVKSDVYDQISYEVEDYGILTISRPCSSHDIIQGIKMLKATRARIKAYEAKTANLEEKMKEIRLVNRAKALLMEHLNMTEMEAHRHIEKAAMDNCVKKSQIAENLIATYSEHY